MSVMVAVRCGSCGSMADLVLDEAGGWRCAACTAVVRGTLSDVQRASERSTAERGRQASALEARRPLRPSQGLRGAFSRRSEPSWNAERTRIAEPSGIAAIGW